MDDAYNDISIDNGEVVEIINHPVDLTKLLT